MSNTADLIRDGRKRIGLTQKQFGEAVGVTATTVTRWELGSAPRLPLIPAIAGVLGVPVEDLVTAAQTP